MARRRLTGARVLLTGASSGIGWSIACQLADAEARLIITARRKERLDQLRQLLTSRGAEVHCVVGDLTESAIREELVQRVEQLWGGLDVLINNAGIGAVGPFAEAGPERLRRIMEVNFFAPAELTRLAIPWLRRGNRPAVVNVASVLAYCAVPGKSEYCASKFALHGWNDAIFAELRREGIDVLMISPNTTRSEFFDHLLEQTSDVAVNPLSMSPDRVAARILRVLRRGRTERILTLSGHALVWLDRFFPRLLRRFLARWG